MTEITDKILDRIRKLLEVANDERGNEGERDNAMRMATNMMAKYQLDTKDIPKAQRDKDDPLGSFDAEGWGLPWVHSIRAAIAKLFGCRYVMMGKINATKHRHRFIGRASNATTAMLMSDWIVRDALREADRVGPHRLSPGGRSFGVGFASRLYTRVDAILASSAADIERELGLSDSRALVVIRQDQQAENEEWISAHMKLGKGRALKPATDGGAYMAGRASADKVNLSKQVSSVPSPKAIR